MFLRKEKEIKQHMEKGELFTSGAGEIKVACIRGFIWATWPGSGDVMLRGCDEIYVKTDGVLCITAFSQSYIIVNRRIPVKHIPREIINKTVSAVKSCIKNSTGESVFGGTVHSIIK